MKKAILLTVVFALISFANAWAQTEAQPTQTTPSTKDKTEKIKHAEEKSDGAAFSGKGKGGDKDMVEKGEKHKDKAKKKGKKAKKGKKGKKKAGKEKTEGQDENKGKWEGQNGQGGTKPQPDSTPKNPRQKPQTGGVKNPKDATPKTKGSGSNK